VRIWIETDSLGWIELEIATDRTDRRMMEKRTTLKIISLQEIRITLASIQKMKISVKGAEEAMPIL